MAHTMNASVWECDFWSTHDAKCDYRQITSDSWAENLPDGWVGVVLTTMEQGDSDYLLMCPNHSPLMVGRFGGPNSIWGGA